MRFFREGKCVDEFSSIEFMKYRLYFTLAHYQPD
jgi:hypothetical protein